MKLKKWRIGAFVQLKLGRFLLFGSLSLISEEKLLSLVSCWTSFAWNVKVEGLNSTKGERWFGGETEFGVFGVFGWSLPHLKDSEDVMNFYQSPAAEGERTWKSWSDDPENAETHESYTNWTLPDLCWAWVLFKPSWSKLTGAELGRSEPSWSERCRTHPVFYMGLWGGSVKVNLG